MPRFLEAWNLQCEIISIFRGSRHSANYRARRTRKRVRRIEQWNGGFRKVKG